MQKEVLLISVLLLILGCTPESVPELQLAESIAASDSVPENSDCVNGEPLFTHSFTDIENLQSVTPIGGIMVGSQSRSYAFVKSASNGSALWVPIYAPVDSTLKQIVYAYRGAPEQSRPEYRIEFQASCDVRYFFDHIAEIAPHLKEVAPKVPAYTTASNGDELSLEVKAGELLGYTDGALSRGVFDFGLFNYAKRLERINPARWTSEHNLFAYCPYDYFTEDLRTKYYDLFASAGGFEPSVKTCRSASRDVEGTLSGAWFQEDATDLKGARLLIADDFDTVDMVLYLREKTAYEDRLNLRDPRPARNPDEVTIGESICYSDGTRYAYFRVLSDKTMEAAIASGTCPSQPPVTGFEQWER